MGSNGKQLKALVVRCVKCDKNPARIGKSRCQKCTDDNNRYMEARYLRKLSAGLCVVCGKLPSDKPLKSCTPCRTVKTRASNDRAMKKRYGIGYEGRDALYKKQGGFCAFCGFPLPKGRMGCIDHDHATGAVRGLLHNDCNLLLGLYEKFGQRFFECVKSYLGEAH